ncbi:hypothetical protein CcI49_19090 [Frankia sp. CcI49]|nr:hypothetical protein CcI49_19090 [Frankia sp. CcI49]
MAPPRVGVADDDPLPDDDDPPESEPAQAVRDTRAAARTAATRRFTKILSVGWFARGPAAVGGECTW